MFGFSRITRHARQWHADRKRIAMENVIFDLPVELQKDIGWPAPMDRQSASILRSDIYARPRL